MPKHRIKRKAHPLLSTKQLYTFCVLARTSNFTRTAAELGCCQSTVTTHIKALERELDTELFKRTRLSKSVILTDAGKLALEYAERFVAIADEARVVVSAMRKSRSNGTPTVTATE